MLTIILVLWVIVHKNKKIFISFFMNFKFNFLSVNVVIPHKIFNS